MSDELASLIRYCLGGGGAKQSIFLTYLFLLSFFLFRWLWFVGRYQSKYRSYHIKVIGKQTNGTKRLDYNDCEWINLRYVTKTHSFFPFTSVSNWGNFFQIKRRLMEEMYIHFGFRFGMLFVFKLIFIFIFDQIVSNTVTRSIKMLALKLSCKTRMQTIFVSTTTFSLAARNEENPIQILCVWSNLNGYLIKPCCFMLNNRNQSRKRA